MRNALNERGLRLRDLVKREKGKSIRKANKCRRAEYISADMPTLINQFRDKEWVRRLKEKINDWYL